METKGIKLYPSSTAFAWGSLSLTDSSNACFRYQQLAHGIYTEIHPKYKEVGDLHEVNYSKSLTVPYDRELPFKWQISDTAYVSGRVDFKLESSITECKATLSPGMQTSLNKGYYKKMHLAQLVVYLGAFGFDSGVLHYGYYGELEGQLTQIKTWDFHVNVDQYGRITVDGNPTDYQAQDVAQHLVKQAEYRQSDDLAPRPAGANSFGGPCHFCPLSPICDAYETGGMSKSLMKEAAEEIIRNKPQHVPQITQIKRRKKND
jgi:hypothetical protein